MHFELKDYRRELTDDEILSDIKTVASQLGKEYISISLYKKHGKYSQCAIQNHFGTWKNALSLAGLRNERMKKEQNRITDEEYYDDLRRVASEINNKTVPYREYERYGKYACGHIFKRFGEWDNALIAAGLFPTGLAHKRIGEQDIFDEIERMWRLLGRQPTSTDIIKHGVSIYSIDTFKRRFGGFRKALEAFVAYINDDSIDKTQESITECYNGVNHRTKSGDNQTQSKPGVLPSKTIHRTSRSITTRMRFLVMKRDNFKCCMCGASPAKDPSVDLHIDHIIPWSKVG